MSSFDAYVRRYIFSCCDPNVQINYRYERIKLHYISDLKSLYIYIYIY